MAAELRAKGGDLELLSEPATRSFLGADPLVLTDDHAPVDQLLTSTR